MVSKAPKDIMPFLKMILKGCIIYVCLYICGYGRVSTHAYACKREDLPEETILFTLVEITWKYSISEECLTILEMDSL